MKALLICPGERSGVSFLSEAMPLVAVPLLGESLLSHWLEHLGTIGAKEVRVRVTDRPQSVEELLDHGARWGLKTTVIPELKEPNPDEVRAQTRNPNDGLWVPAPDDVVLTDHFPGLPQLPLFRSYKDLFLAVLARIPIMAAGPRIGLREIKPGVWVGRRSVIDPAARITPPCWIGENARIGAEVALGPNAVLENYVVAEKAAEIQNSWVGPETYVGALTRITDSLAWGSRLINWRTSSCITVPDSFLMCSLAEKRGWKAIGLSERLTSILPRRLGGRFGVASALKGKSHE